MMSNDTVKCVTCAHCGPREEFDTVVDEPDCYVCMEDDCALGLYCMKCEQNFLHGVTRFGSPEPSFDDIGVDKYVCQTCCSSLKCTKCSNCDLTFLPDDIVSRKGKQWCAECWEEEEEEEEEEEKEEEEEEEEEEESEKEDALSVVAKESTRDRIHKPTKTVKRKAAQQKKTTKR